MKQYKVYSSLNEARNDSFLEKLFREGINHSLHKAVDGVQWVLIWDDNVKKLNTAEPNTVELNTVKLR